LIQLVLNSTDSLALIGVLKPTGTCFVNIDDTYISSGATRHAGYTDPKYPNGRKGRYCEPNALPQSVKEKGLALTPYRLAIAMSDQGWLIRNMLVWWKRNAFPSPSQDRFTIDHEPIIFATKSKRYKFKLQLDPYLLPLDRWGGDQLVANGISEWSDETGQPAYRDRDMRPNKEGKHMRGVWDIPTESSSLPHYAMYPLKLAERMVISGCPEGGTVLDLYSGTGTTGLAALRNNCNYIGIDLSQQYNDIAHQRLSEQSLHTNLF
jgi:DNA modification methylase